jgi:hypothetical protein
MKIKIKRVWDEKLDEYKNVLDKYNANYITGDYGDFAMIEIGDVEYLFHLARELNQDLIISHYTENQIDIYDDYVE